MDNKDRRRAAIEALYEDTCTVVVYTSASDIVTKQAVIIENTKYVNQPCRISDVVLQTTGNGEVAAVVQKKKLFCAPELDIPPGSKIVVMQNGRETAFKNSGKSSVRDTHQEIMLEIFKKWA